MSNDQAFWFLFGRATSDQQIAKRLAQFAPILEALANGKHTPESLAWLKDERLPESRDDIIELAARQIEGNWKLRARFRLMAELLKHDDLAAGLASVAPRLGIETRPALQIAAGTGAAPKVS